MNTAIETTTVATETAAHVAAAKAKLALAAAKKDAKDAMEKLMAEKEAAKQAKIDAIAKQETAKAERSALMTTVLTGIAALEAEHAAFVDLASIERDGKIAALLMTNGLTVDDIGSKPRAKREASAGRPALAQPVAWVKGVRIDASGFVVAADDSTGIYTIGQIGRAPLALAAARDAAIAREVRQNASA